MQMCTISCFDHDRILMAINTGTWHHGTVSVVCDSWQEGKHIYAYSSTPSGGGYLQLQHSLEELAKHRVLWVLASSCTTGLGRNNSTPASQGDNVRSGAKSWAERQARAEQVVTGQAAPEVIFAPLLYWHLSPFCYTLPRVLSTYLIYIHLHIHTHTYLIYTAAAVQGRACAK